jgi:sterol desaturase/sphingolipid hydroxylase (fatty acid hydroxylase superfamily)
MSVDKPLPGWISTLITVAIGGGLFALELRRALRTRNRESKAVRTSRNLTIAALAAVVVHFAETPLVSRVALGQADRKRGLVPWLTRSPALQVALGVLLLDYTLYVWHVLTHRVPLLWRFHLVHHIDLDLDASTALRFHFGEMLLSIPFRLAQVRMVGASPLAVSIWQTFLFGSILFHHSNVRLPYRVERWLALLIATPRLHDIHHRADPASTNSNWSSGLAIWDLLHGTYRWIPDSHPIGVPAYQRASDVRLGRCIEIPFERQRNDWTFEPHHDEARTGALVRPRDLCC